MVEIGETTVRGTSNAAAATAATEMLLQARYSGTARTENGRHLLLLLLLVLQ